MATVAICYLTLRVEHQSAWMSKISVDVLTRSGTGCFIAVPTWQQWASKGQTLRLSSDLTGQQNNYSSVAITQLNR